MTFSVKNKLFFIFILVIILSVSVIGWLGFSSAKDAYIESALTINKGETKALSNEIKGVLGTIPDDVLYNSNFYALEKLIVWEELQDRKKIKHWRNVYVSVLKDYLYNKKLYYQVRILDVNGNEKILLKYSERTNKIVESPFQKLRNKSHRNYFTKAINLKKGEFYISIMDLNVEDGHIEKPYVPVVRYSTPIVDENGITQGVIVLNFNANNILNLIANTKAIDVTRDVQKYYLLNKDGYYLFIGDESKRWGFQLERDYNFNKDYPNVMNKFKDTDEVTFIQGDKIFSMHKIYPNKIANPYRYWYLVTVIDKNVSLQALNNFVTLFFTILISILAIGLFLINNFITKLINPLERVKLQLQALANGEIKKESIKYSANDEIYEIINSTSILVNAIETTINQANAVADGDFTKEIELLSKNDKLGLALQNMMSRLQEITKLSQKLSVGDYDVRIVAKSSSDELGISLINMIKYLENITKVAELISVGEIDVKHSVKGKDDRLGIAIEKMVEYLKTILHQARSITNEDFTQNIEAKSKNDELATALVTMTNMLRDNYTKNRDEVWFSDGVSQFSDSIAESTEITTLAKNSITRISRYIGASSGVFYTFNKEESTLNLMASFAYNSRNNLSNSYKLGSGIIGQVGLEREPILLKNIRDDEYSIESGTTEVKSKEVYAFALIYEHELFGVIELMTLNSFSDVEKEYLSKISSIIATALFTTSQNVQIKHLLDESKKAYEELQVQSEELQESNVQMEEQQQQLTIQSQELKSKNDNLAVAKQEIDQRAQDLEKASKYKNEFLANMSHELRTPLNAIILLSKLLSLNTDKTSTDDSVKKASVINKAGNDLLLLINDILDLSKIESGMMELELSRVTSAEVVDEVEGIFRAICDDKGIEFIINDNFNSSFEADKTKLAQVLKNLLSNAIKFTKEGSVTINIDRVENSLKFAVTDTGIGIPQDKLNNIFNAFVQVDGSISREFGGTGLGLSISKNMVELMNGNIEVESVLGIGTTFTLTLSLNNKSIKTIDVVEKEIKTEIKTVEPLHVEAPTKEIMEFNEDELYGKNVLIVDDDSRNIFTITSSLESVGAEVYNAFNGKEAIEVLDEESKIDIILMDIMMPVMDGLKAIEEIKSSKFKAIPIIAITARTAVKDKQECLDAGANDYLAKPIEHGAIISMIKAWVS